MTTRTHRIPRHWQKLLKQIPGYDSISTAGEAFFVPALAQMAMDFFPTFLRHIEGGLYGQPFRLESWQQAVIANLFGWQMIDAKGRQVRRYREVLLYCGRKNGKSPLIAGLGLFVLFCDKEKGQQDYIAAGEREQAGKLFRYCRGMIEQEPELKQRAKIYGGNAAAGQAKSVVIENEYSFLQVISADAETKHGGTTHLAIIDELHVQPDRNLVDVLKTSLASDNRPEPLLIFVTTADYDRPSICNETYDYACKVRDGVSRNARFLPVIYEAPLSRDGVTLDYTDPAIYRDPRIWALANPNLDVSVSRAYLETESQRAFETPGYLPTFLRLHLNVRTAASSAWLDLQRWDASAGVVDAEALKGRQCWAGLDLGATSDLTSLCLLFPDDDGSYQVLWWNWVPELTARKRANKGDVAYLDFITRGALLTTPGDETDYEEILNQINAIGQDYGIVDIAADRNFQGAQLCQDLVKAGFEVVPWSFSSWHMGAPTQEFERLVNRGELHHGGNPVARWAVGHTICTTDNNGNIKPDKARSSDKIDPCISAIIALGRCMLRPKAERSVYETRGVLLV